MIIGGKYKVVKVIGKGAFSHVIRAINTETKERVAIKILRHTIDKDKVTTNTYKNLANDEITLISKVNHPNVLKILTTFTEINDLAYEGFDVERPKIHIVFEHMEMSLSDLCDKKRLSPYQIQTIMSQILAGVEAIHKANIYHRDLKPTNVLINVSHKIEVKIADFGCAWCYDDKPNYSCGIGTLNYRAPELLLRIKPYTSSVDIWSVGCIFARLILGRRLFEEDKISILLNKILQTLGPPDFDFCTEHGLELTQVKIPLNRIMYSKSEPDMYALNLLRLMFTYRSKDRITATQALTHLYFKQNYLRGN